MEFKSILFGEEEPELIQSEPAYFQDLSLDGILNVIQRNVRTYSLQPYFYTMPKSNDMIEYRHRIFEDIANDTLLDAVSEFCRKCHQSRESFRLAKQSENSIQAAAYHLKAAVIYWEGITRFAKDLAACDLTSDGFQSLEEYVSRHIEAGREKKLDQAIAHIGEIFSQIEFRLEIHRDQITITEEPGEQDYLQELADLLPESESNKTERIQGVFPNPLEPSYLEMTLIEILRKSKPQWMKDLMDFHRSYPDFYSERLLQFEQEVQFYISFTEFKRKIEQMGYRMQFPKISNGRTFVGKGIYDLALVWKNARRQYEVVDNDIKYPQHASFFVVTGPNQGGKTTFARSVGQSVYLAMMGLYTNACSLELPFFDGIATHFEVEESIRSNAGKLKEEIDRLAPMMHRDKKNQFIILNELFTTATTHDAKIMGKKVMQHFLSQDCYGIYVTHIQELAKQTENIISLVAQVEDGSEKKRTYRILPMQAQGYGYSDSLVREYELRYEDIMRRLS